MKSVRPYLCCKLEVDFGAEDLLTWLERFQSMTNTNYTGNFVLDEYESDSPLSFIFRLGKI